jgi:acetylornithine/succinyldiaminopimelate/putrescine aminotransferase
MSALVNTRRTHARTLLQRLHGLERDLELIGRVKGRGVVLDLNAEERYDRHGVWWKGWIVGRKLYWGKDADSGMWQAAGSWSGWW